MGRGCLGPWGTKVRGRYSARRFLSSGSEDRQGPELFTALNPSLSALDRNGGDSYDCSQRVEHYCFVSDKPWKLLPQVDTIDPHDGYMVRAAPKYEVAKLILADLKRSKQPCSLTSWGGVGDDLLGRRTVVTDPSTRPNRRRRNPCPRTRPKRSSTRRWPNGSPPRAWPRWSAFTIDATHGHAGGPRRDAPRQFERRTASGCTRARYDG